MKLQIIDRKNFFKNKSFFKNNLGFVYNYDDKNSLKNAICYDVTIDDSNFTIVRKKAYEDIYEQTLKNFDGDIKFYLAIAIIENKICSIARLLKADNKPWFVLGVETNINFRNRGLAKKVMGKIFSFVEKTNCSQIYLSTWKNNIPAINLYKGLGYTATENNIDLKCYDDINFNNNILFLKNLKGKVDDKK